MLEYNEITQRKYIILDGIPFEVLSSHVFRKQQRKPVNQTKLKNLLSGKVTEKSFHQSEKAEEADITSVKMKYLYNAKGEYWFSEEKNPGNRRSLSQDLVLPQGRFLKENSVIEVTMFEDGVIGIRMPIKIELKVIEAHPAVKGNTAQGATKEVILETGANINVPLFINEGDIVRVNTETSEYAERVSKSN